MDFEGIGMQGLCRAMELYPGSLYGTYGNKRQLFLQAIDRYMPTCSAEGMQTLTCQASGAQPIKACFVDLVDGIDSGRRQCVDLR